MDGNLSKGGYLVPVCLSVPCALCLSCLCLRAQVYARLLLLCLLVHIHPRSQVCCSSHRLHTESLPALNNPHPLREESLGLLLSQSQSPSQPSPAQSQSPARHSHQASSGVPSTAQSQGLLRNRLIFAPFPARLFPLSSSSLLNSLCLLHHPASFFLFVLPFHCHVTFEKCAWLCWGKLIN